MTNSDDRRPPERPRSEPEIIPPDRGGGTRAKPDVFVWVADGEGMRRATLTLPGPLTIFLVLALIALVAGVILIVVLGAVLLWIPVVILMFGALLLAAAARQYWARFRRWASRR
jgi:hypothetical protein